MKQIEGLALSVEGLLRDADEIEACGGGNEAAMMRWAADEIKGLEADLESAVKTAFKRGATEWTRLNYPDLHARFSKPT